jgi:hypothetical protein
LTQNQILVELLTVDLIDRHFIHLFQVCTHLTMDPLINLNQKGKHFVFVFELVCCQVLEISKLLSHVLLDVRFVLIPEFINAFVAQFHGILDSGYQFGHDGELLEPEGRVCKL